MSQSPNNPNKLKPVHKTITECLIEMSDQRPEGSDKTYRELLIERAKQSPGLLRRYKWLRNA